ncbi:Agouti-signaling protein [Pelecanus crispus]|uniref:Agouti-signaling protein n=1 Tax=Pelecanus crispus TaxID=36300 RepID=A0A091T189_PELCR|nr:Agouti-signaling protein [Pelecanus crispus]
MTMPFFLPRMERKNFFLSLLLCYGLLRAAASYMAIEEKTECNLSRSNKMNLQDLPPISIVGWSRIKESQQKAENKKSSKKNAGLKTSPKPRPPPAADCVLNFRTCKPHLNSCCNYCALCKCRIFQTICQCLMLNPKC